MVASSSETERRIRGYRQDWRHDAGILRPRGSRAEVTIDHDTLLYPDNALEGRTVIEGEETIIHSGRADHRLSHRQPGGNF